MKKTIALSMVAVAAGLVASATMAAKREVTLATFATPKGADGSAGCSPEVTVVDSETPGCVVITTQNKERVSGSCVASGDPYTKTVCNGEKGQKGDDGSFDDTVTEVYQMPANCSGDVGSQNCAAAGYIKKMNGDTVLGTIADTCLLDKDRTTASDSKAKLRQKCKYPNDSTLQGLTTGYAGEFYYVQSSTDVPVQCIVETSTYSGSDDADKVTVNGNNYYTKVAETTITRTDHCLDNPTTTTKKIPDRCELVNYDETAESAFEYYECKRADGTGTYTYRKSASTAVSKINAVKTKAVNNESALATKANAADVENALAAKVNSLDLFTGTGENKKVIGTLMPTTVVQTTDGKINANVLPTTVVQTADGKINANVLPTTVVQTTSGKIDANVLPTTVVQTTSGKIDANVLPTTVVQTTSGKIDANVLPTTVVQTTSGKIDRDLLAGSMGIELSANQSIGDRLAADMSTAASTAVENDSSIVRVNLTQLANACRGGCTSTEVLDNITTQVNQRLSTN